MPRMSALLLASGLLAVAVGGGVVAFASTLQEDATAANALMAAGLVTAAVGVHGVLAWVGLTAATSGAARATRWLEEAEAHRVAGRLEYARTFYEEALRAGGDPDVIVPRLAVIEARSERS